MILIYVRENQLKRIILKYLQFYIWDVSICSERLQKDHTLYFLLNVFLSITIFDEQHTMH
jgi:hypothetical protein